MTGSSELASLSLAQAAELVRTRRVSPTELVHACIDQIEAWESTVKALVTRMDDEALRAAEAAERELMEGTYRGPLHGIPVMAKDLIDVEGIPTTASSRQLGENIADGDATVISALKAAGAVVSAKTNTHEFALGALTPPTRNPWDPARMPGGSSGGSGAAVASGMAFGALGTDTGGSIREPSALCGLAGLKPTFGRLGRSGIIPLAWSLDVVGPMARTIEDCGLMLAAMDRPDPADLSWVGPGAGSGDPTPVEVDGLRVGVGRELMDLLEPDVRSALEGTLTALDEAGARLEDVSIGPPDDLSAVLLVILMTEAAAYHRPWMESSPELYEADILGYLKVGAAITGADYIDCQRYRGLVRDRLARAFERVDVVVAPAQHVVAPRVDIETVAFPGGVERPRDLSLIRPFVGYGLAGNPGLSAPIGRDRRDLPIGMQFVGRPFEEERLLATAAAIQQLTGWQPRLPAPSAD